MTRSLTLYILCLILLLPASGFAGPAPNILVLGDSLSAAYGIDPEKGWVSLLQRRLKDKRMTGRVINASITGDTTRGGLTRLPGALIRHRPAIVIIELGGNDGLRGLSLQAMHANLFAIVETVRDAGAEAILLGVRLPANYGKAYGERFHQVYYEVARETGIPLVDFFLKGVAETTHLMQADGIHPGAAAQPRILDNIWPTLAPLLSKP